MNTHGNKQFTKQFGSGFTFDVDNYLHSFFILRNGESATIISVLPYFNALTAPMLRPHRYTL
jgi:hypothetical protein